jgi:tRNA nucleotidyltransferase (CCA-adding enzyme)
MPASESQIVLERLRELPGGPELLRLAEGRNDVVIELVGGAVRDLLLGRTPRELDVTVGGAGDDNDESFPGAACAFARDLACSLGLPAAGDPGGNGLDATTVHERFGTARVEWDGGRIDIASRRTESYTAPGALPDVHAGSPGEDLARRDFTVNAISVMLNGRRAGEVHAAPGALEDLRAGRLRVLHDGSFLDDPTRLLRLARYRARLSLQIEPHTAELAARALAARALDTVSGARLGAELRLALVEPDATGALAAMDDLGLLAALHPRLRFDRAAIERGLALLPEDGRPDLLLMAALALPLALRAADDPRTEITALLDRLEFAAADRDRIAATAVAVPRLTNELTLAAEHPSRLRAAVAGAPPEGIALTGGVSPPASAPARRWLTELRNVRLIITGEDLLAAGLPEGPEIGARLDAALDRKLDGELTGGREAELAVALEVRI